MIGLKLLGQWLARLGQADAALAAWREALATARTSGPDREAGMVLCNLALEAWRAGEREEAERLVAAARDLLRRVGERQALSQVATLAGRIALARGRTGEARARLEEALRYADELDFPENAVTSRQALGDLARAEGDAAAAARRYGEALRIARDRSGAMGVALALLATAGLWVARGRPERAVRLYGAERALRPAGAPAPARGPGLFVWRYEEDLAAARAALGDEAFAAAWAQGQDMPLEEAVAFALEDAPTAA